MFWLEEVQEKKDLNLTIDALTQKIEYLEQNQSVEQSQKDKEEQRKKIAEMEKKMFEIQNEMIFQRSNFNFFKAQMGIPTEVILPETESQEPKIKPALLNW